MHWEPHKAFTSNQKPNFHYELPRPTADTVTLKSSNRVNSHSVVEWSKHRTDDQHGLGSKPTCAILLCPWERHVTAHSPVWWS